MHDPINGLFSLLSGRVWLEENRVVISDNYSRTSPCGVLYKTNLVSCRAMN